MLDRTPVAYADRHWTSDDGLLLYARDYAAAAGPAKLPVIAIHGLTRNSADFGTIAPLIAQSGRRVLAIDVRGRGLSEWADEPMSYVPTTYAKDVLKLMHELGIERAIFLGTSMGGLITMAIAAVKSRVIAAAILNDVGPEVAREGLMRIASYSGKAVDMPDWAAAAAYARDINGVAFPHYQDADWDAFARRIFREDADERPVLNYDPDISAPIRAAGSKVLVPNLWPAFARLTKGRATLLVRGETSDLLSPKIASKMRHRAPRMDYVEVPGVGHAPMLDEPAAKSVIFAFLSEQP